MSATARPGPDVPEEKKKGLSKYVSRMKTVLRRNDGSKRLSLSGRSPAVAGPSTIPATTTPVAESKPSEGPQPTKLMRSQVEADRARRLGERFALNLEPLSTGPDKEAFRVEKPIRMRVHRSCHRCSTAFGSNKICIHCDHVLCKLCPRQPIKNERKGKEKEKENAPVVLGDIIEPDRFYALQEKIQLTKPNPKPGGLPLVRKKPQQRVRRNCHACAALFAPGSKICASCAHIRCADCPRDPAKKKKYPDGYPGDAPSSDPTIPIKYSCHRCSKVFPAVPNPAGPGAVVVEQECVRCQHPRCADCPRAPIVKVEPAPDPEVLRSVQAKLAALNVESVET